jgi:hypothetical protein
METGQPSFPHIGTPQYPGGPLATRSTPSDTNRDVRPKDLQKTKSTGDFQQRRQSPARDSRPAPRRREHRSKSPEPDYKKVTLLQRGMLL